jgi:SAM-dependent methyltransferase
MPRPAFLHRSIVSMAPAPFFLSLYRFAFQYAIAQFRAGRTRRGLYLLLRSVDYWRVREFSVSWEYLEAAGGEQILDVSSPKLFPAFVAARTRANVRATDVYDDGGLKDADVFRRVTGTQNLAVEQCDVRKLPYPDAAFDKVLSISVLEHVAPSEGGDVVALREIRRVLRPGGLLVLTLPYSNDHKVEFASRDVYERKRDSETEELFYQRRYNKASLERLLLSSSELVVESSEFLCEPPLPCTNREVWTLIGEGNKIKRLVLAPLNWIFAIACIRRRHEHDPGSRASVIALKIRKASGSPSSRADGR